MPDEIDPTPLSNSEQPDQVSSLNATALVLVMYGEIKAALA